MGHFLIIFGNCKGRLCRRILFTYLISGVHSSIQTRLRRLVRLILLLIVIAALMAGDRRRRHFDIDVIKLFMLLLLRIFIILMAIVVTTYTHYVELV